MSLLQIVQYLFEYDVLFLSASFAALWLFGAINMCCNVYRSQNRKFEKCRASVLRSPKFTGVFVANLSEEYRRQWRAFVNSDAERPSLVFEFVPLKNKTHGKLFLWASAAVSAVYLSLFVVDSTHREYAVFQVAFWMTLVVISMLNAVVYRRNENRARRIFGRFVAQLNAVDYSGTAKNSKTISQELRDMAKSPCSDSALRKIGELLRKDGLNNNRTADEQRSVNGALNSLLQAYARNAEKIQN